MSFYGREIKFKYQDFRFHNKSVPGLWKSKSSRVIERAERQELQIEGVFTSRISDFLEKEKKLNL